MSLLDLIRKAKPEELRELRTTLDTLSAPTRPEMDPTERRTLGSELAASYESVMVKGAAAFEAKRADLEDRIRVAQEALFALSDERARTVDAYTARRDLVMARLWAERQADVDVLICQVKAEAAGLRVQSEAVDPSSRERYFEPLHLLNFNPRVTGEIVRDDVEPWDTRVVSTGRSVEARRRGLLALAEQVSEWTCKGVCGSASELREMFARQYAKLPAVDSLAELRRQGREVA